MTKDELIQVVERVYASWNQQLPAVDKRYKAVMNAWWEILGNLNKQDVDVTINTLIIEDNPHMPRPGTIYRETMRTTSDYNPPTAAEAWDQLRQASEAAHNGTHTNITIHPTVHTAIEQLGGTNAYRLHTNGDRELFTQTYKRAVLQEEARLFRNTPTTG